MNAVRPLNFQRRVAYHLSTATSSERPPVKQTNAATHSRRGIRTETEIQLQATRSSALISLVSPLLPATRPCSSRPLTSRSSSTTSPPRPSTTPPPRASAAQDGTGEPSSRSFAPSSPALSTASTADGSDDLESSPGLPSLPAPTLPARALELLRTPPPGTADEVQFGTASWGSPYPRTDQNLRRLSFSSEPSEDSPIHQLAIDTPFLRPQPELLRTESEPQPPTSAAAAVLANRARRQTRRLTEDWIRTHTAGDNAEPRHWFSDGSSEHSSLSGSESGGVEERDPRTPKATAALRTVKTVSRHQPRHPRGRSSIDTLKPGDSFSLKPGDIVKMDHEQGDIALLNAAADTPPAVEEQDSIPATETPKKTTEAANGEAKAPVTPTKGTQKPLPKAPLMTPRLKKKVPWKGKNIMVLLPRDDQRGLPGNAPKPLRQHEIERMFSSWQELGYGVDGFDLLVEGYQPPGTDDSQSRDTWPNFDDIDQERHDRKFKVTLPDLKSESL